MKKQIAILGIIVLLLSVGLNGCTYQPSNVEEGTNDNIEDTNGNLIDFLELKYNLYKYANTEISIRGEVWWILGKNWNRSTYNGMLADVDWHMNRIDLIIPANVDLLHGLIYTITGIVREPEIYGDNSIIEVTSAKLDMPGGVPDNELYWAFEHGLSFVEEHISNQSEYAYGSGTGGGYIHHGVFNASIEIWFHTEDDERYYTNKYTLLMTFNENSDMTNIDNWNLLSITVEKDIYSQIQD